MSGIIYLTPTYNSVSEVWQQRHIQMLSEHIEKIVTIDTDERKWQNKIPVVNINPDKTLLVRIKKKLNINFDSNKVLSDKLDNLLNKDNIIFIQYLNFAVKFKDTINKCTNNVYIHVHGFDITWDLRQHNNPSNPAHNKNYIDTVKQLDEKVKFIANSNNTRLKLEEIGIPEHRIMVKYLGTEILASNRDDNMIKSDTLNVLYLGRLVDFKGADMVIQSFERACDKGFRGVLKIAGDGYLRETCELLRIRSKYKSDIEILGAVNKKEADELRQWADIFVAQNCVGQLSRQEEAFGVSIIEAMAAGLPVLTGKSGGVVETVVHEETGLLNEPYNIEEQANNLLKLYNNRELIIQMGTAAEERVKNYFSVSKEKAEFKKILFNNYE